MDVRTDSLIIHKTGFFFGTSIDLLQHHLCLSLSIAYLQSESTLTATGTVSNIVANIPFLQMTKGQTFNT